MVKNRYWKSLLGSFADVLVAKSVDYAGTGTSTSATDFKTFVANAVEGEIGVFDADTLLLISGVPVSSAVVPIPTSERVFIAMKRDGIIEQTLPFKPIDYNLKRTAYAAGVAGVATVTFSGVPVAGNYYEVKVLETTPGYQPYPTWLYGVTAKTGETLSALLGRITALINDGTNVINLNTTPVVTATNTGTVITLTGKVPGESFRLALSFAALNDLAGVTAVTTPPFYGNGVYWQVAELEFESNVFKGITTQYPNQGANPGDYGTPSVFASASAQYSTYIFRGVRSEMSPTPSDRHFKEHLIILAIPSNGSANADAEVKGLFGL